MTARAATAAVVLTAALWASASALAQECPVKLGRGWPPATANYGAAVERLFNGDVPPALSMTWLPGNGKETGLLLLKGAEGVPWTVRYSEADKRVHRWVRNSLVLQIEQIPEQATMPIPPALGQRLLEVWGDALRRLVPETTPAAYYEGDVLTAVVDGVRFSGPLPDCGPAGLLLQQAQQLIEASEEKEPQRERRLRELDASLQALQQSFASQSG